MRKSNERPEALPRRRALSPLTVPSQIDVGMDAVIQSSSVNQKSSLRACQLCGSGNRSAPLLVIHNNNNESMLSLLLVFENSD